MTQTSALQFSESIAAPISAVWECWTTCEGVMTFFARECSIDLRSGGAYEMYFNLAAESGSRGGEGCVILALENKRMLSLTWNAPPEFPVIRAQKTHVIVRFKAISAYSTLVTLQHDGWGEGEDWQQVRAYFENAWGRIVLPRLKQRFINGPMGWDNDESEG